MKLSNHINLERFKGEFTNEEMFSLHFIAGGSFKNVYRGWPVKKAKKVAKMLQKLARKLEKL